MYVNISFDYSYLEKKWAMEQLIKLVLKKKKKLVVFIFFFFFFNLTFYKKKNIPFNFKF
jgi:hypothetical protein